jgi:hypothetical protein
MTATVPNASDLLTKVFDALYDTKLPFVVLRNHEGLPFVWGNDIDILVEPVALDRAHRIVLETLQRASESTPVESMRRLNFRATRRACADRELQIDLYSRLSKGWITYADTEAILSARQSKHPHFCVPDPIHEALLIAAKELFSYGEIRVRYHAKLANHDTDQAKAAAQAVFKRRLNSKGQRLVVKALVDPTVKGSPGLRMRSLLHPGLALRWAIMRQNRWGTPALSSNKTKR